MKKVVLMLILATQCFGAKQIRSEINRYRLLSDRLYTEKSLLSDPYSNFLSLDFNISCGLKDLIGSIESSQNKKLAADKALGINEALSKNINTERFIALDVGIGIPLPFFTYSHFGFLPTLFYQTGIGGSLSINNQIDVLMPVAQIYIQKSSKFGISTKINSKKSPRKTYGVALYKRTRSDLSVARNALAISGGDGIIDLDELDKNELIYGIDLSFKKEEKDYGYLLEIRDLKIRDAGSELETSFGNQPLFHARYSKSYSFKSFSLKTHLGFHYRKSYNITQAIYFGLKLRIKKDSPILIIGKIDNEFINYNVGLTFSHFQFHYGIKSPYKNPQEDMWVSSIHQISVRVPF